MNSKLDTNCTKRINVRGRRKEDFDKSVFVNATGESSGECDQMLAAQLASGETKWSYGDPRSMALEHRSNDVPTIKYIFEQLRTKTSLKMERIMILFWTNDSNKIERLNSSLWRLRDTNYVYRLC